MTIDREKFSLMSNWYRNDQAGKSSNSIDSLNRVKIEAISIEINRLGFWLIACNRAAAVH